MSSHNQEARNPQQLVFHPQRAEEYNIPRNYGNLPVTLGVRPHYREFSCGSCGARTTGRVLCDVTRLDGNLVMWLICSCERKEPAVLIEVGGTVSVQLPQCKLFHSDQAWPPELSALYDEAARAFAAAAYTSSSLICRKLLMSCACHEQERAGKIVQEGKSFAFYVDYLANEVLTFPPAKAALDAIREIGNEATHHVAMISQPNAERSMKVVSYLLNALYSFPTA